MDWKRIIARDRRDAAVHEAGHVVVARQFGCEIASAWIIPVDNPGPDETTWTGRVQIKPPADPLARRMVGVAGEVAEHLWASGWIEDFCPYAMSEGDRRLAGWDSEEPDDALIDALLDAAAEVGRLLSRDGPQWQTLIAETRRLIVQSR
jgi:hypothetical protein